MNKIKRFACCALAAASVLSFGGWTQPYSGEQAQEERYSDAPAYSLYSTETVHFTSKQTDMKINDAPSYTTVSGLTNACGAVAGAEVVGYYDKYYETMMPLWESFYPSTGMYKAPDPYFIPAVIRNLYSCMHTNENGVGVSKDEFIYGLTLYINGKNYNVTYQSVLNGSSIDYSACKAAINNNKVIVLFTRATDVYRIVEGSAQDMISSISIGDLHIMVASGYREVSYYNGNTLIRTDKYLYGSSGSVGVGMVHYKVDPHNLNYAYIVNIS